MEFELETRMMGTTKLRALHVVVDKGTRYISVVDSSLQDGWKKKKCAKEKNRLVQAAIFALRTAARILEVSTDEVQLKLGSTVVTTCDELNDPSSWDLKKGDPYNRWKGTVDTSSGLDTYVKYIDQKQGALVAFAAVKKSSDDAAEEEDDDYDEDTYTAWREATTFLEENLARDESVMTSFPHLSLTRGPPRTNSKFTGGVLYAFALRRDAPRKPPTRVNMRTAMEDILRKATVAGVIGTSRPKRAEKHGPKEPVPRDMALRWMKLMIEELENDDDAET